MRTPELGNRLYLSPIATTTVNNIYTSIETSEIKTPLFLSCSISVSLQDKYCIFIFQILSKYLSLDSSRFLDLEQVIHFRRIILSAWYFLQYDNVTVTSTIPEDSKLNCLAVGLPYSPISGNSKTYLYRSKLFRSTVWRQFFSTFSRKFNA